MILFNIPIAYLVLMCIYSCHVAYGEEGDCEIAELTPEQEALLIKIYGFEPNPSGTLIAGRIWEATEMRAGGEPLVHGRTLIMKEGFCARWRVFTIDRIYHWHEGDEIIIDMIHPNGTHVRECLGSTALDADCKYAVAVPKGWIAVLKMDKNLAITTNVVINGDRLNGTTIDYSVMIEMFGSCHSDIIEETERCYQ